MALRQMSFVKITLLFIGVQQLVGAVPVQIQQNVGEPEKSCKLIFHVENIDEGQPKLVNVTVPSMQNLLVANTQKINCSLVISAPSQSKMRSVAAETEMPLAAIDELIKLASEIDERKGYDQTKPLYELQLTVWPTDVQDIVEAVQAAVPQQQDILHDEELMNDNSSSQIPLYEEQMVVFPEFDDTEDDTEQTDISNNKPTNVVIGEPIEVVESFHLVHPNGTSEYKLVLNNGLVNYKKIYNKIVGNKVITVQEGYDSIPIPGHKNEFQTQYYIADEHGHNVYRVEHNMRRPELPVFLSYENEITKMKNT